MKKMGDVLMVLGVLLLAYSLIGKFVNGPSIFGYIYPIDPKTGVLFANTLLLLAVLAKLEKK